MSDSESRSALVLELAEEFLERCRKGDRPPLKEYTDRHPELAAEIKEIFPAMAMMENIAVIDESIEADRTIEIPRLPQSAARQLGDYRIIREIGHGGMGVVYEAEQVSLGRHVALKLLPNHALHDAKQKRRFEREAKAAAKLHHTNIVPVFGVGEHDGVPFYVMQFIQGLGLDAVLDELNRLQQGGAPTPTGLRTGGEIRVERRDVSAADVARSLMSGTFEETSDLGEDVHPKPQPALDATLDQVENADSANDRGHQTRAGSGRLSDSFTVSSSSIILPGSSGTARKAAKKNQSYWQSVASIGRQVAEALEYAHKQGVQHRDVKPSNLLLDMRGTVWVTDFGLAKLANPDAEDLTHTGDILGTLRYMPPEAFEGKSDVRGDVYSLGLTLYELLAKRPAFDEKDRNKLIKQVTSGEPTPLDKVNGEIPRDLVTIVQKAVEREPSRRYATAEELAADLQRFVDDEPIQARRQTHLERCIRWARHHPSIAVLGGVLSAVLVFATVASLLAAGHFNRLRQEAKWQEQVANGQRLVAQGREEEATAAKDDAMNARNAAALQAAGLLLDKGIEDARSGEPARAVHLFVKALATLPADDPKAAPLERVIRANLAAWAETVPALEHIWPTGSNSEAAAYSRDGGLIAMAVGTGAVRCYRTDPLRPIGPAIKVPLNLQAAMEFAADGKSLWIAAAERKADGERWGVHRFDVESGRELPPPIPSSGPVHRLLATPDGRHLVGAVRELHPDDDGGIADASRSHRWRTASIVTWETATGRVVRKEAVNAVTMVATAQRRPEVYLGLSADGRTVAAWVQRGADRFEEFSFKVEGNEPPVHRKLPAVGHDVRWNLHFENNMRTGLAIKDDKLHRWSAAEPGVLGPGIPAPFRAMLYCPSADGRSVVSPTDGRVFDTGAWPPRATGVRFAHPGWQRSLNAWSVLSPDGRFAATWDSNSEIGGRFWRLPRPHSRPALPSAESTRQPERTESFHSGQFDPVASSAVLWYQRKDSDKKGEEILIVRVVDATTGAVRDTSIRHEALVREVVFSPDGRHFATASFDATARVWETATGRPAGPVLSHANYVATVAFSPDGNTLVAGDYGPAGLAKFWNWRTGKEVRPAIQHDDIILNVAMSQDGRYLAVTKAEDWSSTPEFIVWEIESGKAVIRKRQKAPYYWLKETAQFRPDIGAVTTRDENGVLRLWEISSGKLLGERPLDGDGVSRFSPDGRTIAAAANLGVRLLDGGTLAPLPGGYLSYADQIKDLAFSRDGAFLLVGYESGSAQLWEVSTRKPIGPPAVLIGAILSVAFTPDGRNCVCVASDGAVRRWPVPVPFAEPDLVRLAERVSLMTGLRMDDNQGLDAVPAGDWRDLRSKLAGEGSTALFPPRSDVEWHDARAADAEQDGDAFGADWHLDRLAKLRSGDWTIPARRGRVLGAAGRKDEADAAYAMARRLAPSAQALSDWLRAAADDSNAAGRKDWALWNLNSAVALTPEDWTLYVLRAGMDPTRAEADVDEAIRRGSESSIVAREASRSAATGNWKRSAALFNRLDKDPSMSAEDRYVVALTNLRAGDVAGYRAACARIAKELAPIGPKLFALQALLASKAFTMSSKATDDWTKPLAWSDHTMARFLAFEKANPDKKDALRRERHLFISARGAVLFRAGRFADAAKVLRDAMSFHPEGGAFQDWVFLALAEHRLGHADDAKKATTKARSIQSGVKPRSVWDKAEVDTLAAELDSTLPHGK